MSPDGERILVPTPRTGGEILDLSGAVIASGPDLGGVWADDSRHICTLRPKYQGQYSGYYDLLLIDPGRSERVITRVPGLGFSTGATLESCSIQQNEALIFTNVGGLTGSATYVDLGDGTKRAAAWPRGGIFALSGNGRFVAVGNSDRPTLGGRLPQSLIVDTQSGKVVGSVAGQVVSLSWLGDVAVEELSRTEQTAVVDWRTGETLWTNGPPSTRLPSFPSTFTLVQSRPQSDDIALEVLPRNMDPHQQPWDLWLIAVGHAPRLLDSQVGPE